MASLKYHFCILLLTATITISTQQLSGQNRRMGKLFGGVSEVTKVSVYDLTVKTIIPSSCVAYEPTLRPCKRFRFLNYGPQNYNLWGPSTPNITTIENRKQSPIQSTPPLAPAKNNTAPSKINTNPTSVQYWGDYFNFIRGVATKTATVTRIVTDTYLDPARVITFSIKHCLPSSMPFNLPQCPPPVKEIDVRGGTNQEDIGNFIEPTVTQSIPVIQPTIVPKIEVDVNVLTTETIQPSENV